MAYVHSLLVAEENVVTELKLCLGLHLLLKILFSYMFDVKNILSIVFK